MSEKEPAPPLPVIVTRPAGDAMPLIDLLREQGREVIAFPVLGIEPVDDATRLSETMARLSDYRLVVFVSPNAIRHAIAHLRGPWPRDVTIAVMGPGSIAALGALGITAPDVRIVSPADGAGVQGDASDAAASLRRYDSEALLAALDRTLALHAGFDGRVLIVRGNGGRAWFADRLRERGIAADEVESYRRVKPDPDAASTIALRRLFREDREAIFVVTSSEGLTNLIAMVEGVLEADGSPGHAVRDWVLGCPLVAPHARIAEKARRMGFSKAVLAEPGDAGIAATIE
jgi:uroporphyrinogen III methyltransferase/synthase